MQIDLTFIYYGPGTPMEKQFTEFHEWSMGAIYYHKDLKLCVHPNPGTYLKFPLATTYELN